MIHYISLFQNPKQQNKFHLMMFLKKTRLQLKYLFYFFRFLKN